MKKLIIISILGLVGWTSYSDMTEGVLPSADTGQRKTDVTQTVTIPYKNYQVAPGDTVLSVVEKLNPNDTIAIQRMVNDFNKLNPNTDPNHIRIGRSYAFPIYKNK
ncbi:hypothetical protein EV207_1033 [Scopulibacillus darangshiensis]|uniref:LysM domain-containing protein n=1 Tax=Scopulibacillus darangshiensis TaxID=442528 RepID=A0A4R2P9V1_9BACL|nr:hypothetical protein [Scopulibacillus darangshiensis]TCP31128.1 hypothetical protein EV207_1033 [Scopulibacillus darangshiensis]